MSKAPVNLLELRTAPEVQPWPKPGSDLEIVQYGAWLGAISDSWASCSRQTRRAFDADRRKVKRLTNVALLDLRKAVERYGMVYVAALEEEATHTSTKAVETTERIDKAEPHEIGWFQAELRRSTEWAADLELSIQWSRHRTRAWLKTIDSLLDDPLKLPLVALGVPDGGEEIPDCPWKGVFDHGWRSYPNDSPPSRTVNQDYERTLQTSERFDGPKMHPPASYLQALSAQASSPWMVCRVLDVLLGQGAFTPRNEFVEDDTLAADLQQKTEWSWFAVSPVIRAWYARHQPAAESQPVLKLWEKRVAVRTGRQTTYVHAAKPEAQGHSLTDWFAHRVKGRLPTSQDAESLALSVAALLDTLDEVFKKRRARKTRPKIDKATRDAAILGLRLKYQKKHGVFPSDRWVARNLPESLRCDHKTVGSRLERMQDEYRA